MRKDISSFVKQCDVCQKCKPYKRIQPPVAQIPVTWNPRFKDLQINVVGPHVWRHAISTYHLWQGNQIDRGIAHGRGVGSIMLQCTNEGVDSKVRVAPCGNVWQWQHLCVKVLERPSYSTRNPHCFHPTLSFQLSGWGRKATQRHKNWSEDNVASNGRQIRRNLDEQTCVGVTG